MTDCLLSVIVPVRDRQALAERALASILDQDFDRMEVVIVDDGSRPPFKLPPELSARSRHIRVVRHESSRGAAAARNTGVANSLGEWFAFLDSDDFFLPSSLGDRFQHAVELESVSAAPLVHVSGFIQLNLATGGMVSRIPKSSLDPLDFAGGCWFSPGSTSLMRRTVYNLVGPADERLLRLEDFDWYLRLAHAGGGVAVWDGLAAVVEIGGKPAQNQLNIARQILEEKYLLGSSSERLYGKEARRVAAYLALEGASVAHAERRWLDFALEISRSWILQPRSRLHLEAYWRHSAVASEMEDLVERRRKLAGLHEPSMRPQE